MKGLLFILIFILGMNAFAEEKSNFENLLLMFEQSERITEDTMGSYSGYTAGTCITPKNDSTDYMLYINDLSFTRDLGPSLPLKTEYKYKVAMVPTYVNKFIKGQEQASLKYKEKVETLYDGDFYKVENDVHWYNESSAYWISKNGFSCNRYVNGCINDGTNYVHMGKYKDMLVTLEWTNLSSEVLPLEVCYFYKKY